MRPFDGEVPYHVTTPQAEAEGLDLYDPALGLKVGVDR
jgi:hypothetical protein